VSIPLLKKKIIKEIKHGRPILAVIAVLGTTEEGAFDKLDEIIELRK